jgi:Amt family ammonium transporter
VIGPGIKRLGGFRVSTEAEVMGIDEAEHAEVAYSFSGVTGGSLTGMASSLGAHGPVASPPPSAPEPVSSSTKGA